MRRRYGSVVSFRLVGFGPLVAVADPALIRQVFTERPDVLHAGGDQNPLVSILGEHSLLVIDEDHHLQQRKLLLPPFHGERMRAYESLIAEITEQELATWPDGEIETLPAFRRVTLRAILRAVFGAQGAEVDELERVLPPFVDLGAAMATLGRPLQKDLGPLSPWGRFLRRRAEVDRKLDALIERARTDTSEREDILSRLVATPMTNAEIRDQLVTLLVAGHETTASSLAWAVERMRRHPETIERLHDRAYRDAFIREVLRQRPVVSFAARSTLAPYELGGYVLPAGVRIALAASLTHFDPDLFPEPDRFRPERFLDAKPDTYAWIPFGGGVRRCIGAAFAHMEMEVVLRTLVERMEIAGDPGLPDAGWKFRGVTQVPADGGRAVVRRRAAA